MVDSEAENADLGHPNDSLSEDEKHALRQVAERVRNGGPDGPSLTHLDGRDPFLVCDHYLLRFLRARNWDVEKTCLMLKNHYAWRVEKNIAELYKKPMEGVQHIKRFYPHGYHGVDKIGRSVYIEKLGAIDMPMLLTESSPEQIIAYFSRESEISLRQRLPAASLAKGSVVDRSLSILDLNGLSFRFATHTTARKVVKQIIAVSGDNYPELMGEIVIINAPRVFSLAWSAVKPMLDEKTVAKIKIYSHCAKDYLAELIGEENVPEM